MKKIFKGLIIILIIPLFFLVSCGKGESTPQTSISTNLKEFDNVYMNDLTVIYDGDIHSLKVSGEYPSNTKITYQNNDQVDAGIYEVKATVTCDGYNTKILSANLTIEKAEYDIAGVQFLNKTVIYNGNEQTIEITGTLPEGLKVKYENNKLTNVGQTVAKVHFISTNPNYKDLPTLEATLTVLKYKVEITKENFPDAEYEYDGKEKKITLNIALPKGIKVTYYNNTLTEPGKTEATVELELKDMHNYEPLEITQLKAILKINVPSGLVIERNREGTLTVTKYNGNSKTLYIPSSFYGQTVTIIDDFSFESCNTLNSVVIPETIINIGNAAFFNCENLMKVNIPSSVGNIGNKAFMNCINLSNVELSNGIKMIGNSAFFNCKKLKNIQIPNTVVSIGTSAFENCSTLEKVKLSNNLEEISDRLFAKSGHGDFNVEIPNGITTIGEQAFDQSGIKNVLLPVSIKKIGDEAFSYSSLKNINLPDSIEDIGYSAFRSTEISTITIPKGIKEIKSSLFNNCDSLTEVILNDSLEKIGDEAFYYCNLKSITIPNSVTRIGYAAFESNKSLLKVYLPNSIKHMGSYVFQDCTALTYIFIEEGTDTSKWDRYWNNTSAEIIIGKKETL